MTFPKFKVVLLLFIVFRLGQSIRSVEKISVFFSEYRNLERPLWDDLFSYLGGENSKQRLLQKVLDYHKTYLSLHPLFNGRIFSNKLSRKGNWTSFRRNMQPIRIEFKELRRILSLTEEITIENPLVRDLSYRVLNNSDAFLKSINKANELLANFKQMRIRRKCSLATEYSLWESLFYNVYVTLLRTYILTEYAWMYYAIQENGVHYLKPMRLRKKFMELEQKVLNNYKHRIKNITNHPVMQCPARTNSLKHHHNVTFPSFFSLREVTSDIEENMVIVGFRLSKHQIFYHLQIKQGQLGPEGTIVKATDKWKTIDYLRTHESIPGIDYFKVTKSTTVLLESEVRRERPYAVTGLKLTYNNGSEDTSTSGLLSLMVRFNEIDVENQQVVKNITDSWIQTNNADNQFQPTSNFYLDKRGIKPKILTPLTGAGIYCNLKHNRSEDVFCYPRVFAFMP